MGDLRRWGCIPNINDCKCSKCQKAKKETIEINRKGRINAQTTFGPIKYGKPDPSRRVMKPAVTDIEPLKITDDNYYFVTGIPLKGKILTPQGSGK